MPFVDKIKINVDIEEFHRCCGEILRFGVAVENNLELFITSYFCANQNSDKFNIFNDAIVIDLSFERKLNVFKLICKEEDVDKILFQKTLNAIHFVQRLRNKVAHWHSGISGTENFKITLQKKTSLTLKKDEIPITPELVKKTDKERINAINKLDEIYQIISSPNRVRKIKTF